MSTSADMFMVHRWALVEVISPVIIVPMSRKHNRKMFPAKVPHLSIIFPSLMMKMSPNI